MPEVKKRVPPPSPGIYRGVPFETYTQWDAASNTLLGKLARSAAHAKAMLDGHEQDTDAKRLGRPIHTAVFEPSQLEHRYVVAKMCEQRTKEGASCKNTGLWVDEQRGWVCGVHGKGRDDYRLPSAKEVISGDEFAMCEGIREGVKRSISASLIIAEPAEFELSIVWIDPATGVTCKARLDVYNPQFAGGTIADGKSTDDARRVAFQRSILNFGYYRQAAMYRDGAREVGLQAEHFAFLAFEKPYPHLCKVHRILDDLIAKGQEEVRALLEQYAHCRATDSWPGYPDDIEDIGVPAYGIGQIDDRIREISERTAA